MPLNLRPTPSKPQPKSASTQRSLPLPLTSPKLSQLQAASWVLIGIIGRLMPHLPNMTPMVSLSVIGNTSLRLRYNLLMLAVTMLLANAILALWHGYPLASSWCLANCGGLLCITLLGRCLPRMRLHSLNLLGQSLFLSTIYWGWLNAQTWICTTLYPLNWHGFILAQTAGIPFLRNMYLADVGFLGAFIAVSKYLQPALLHHHLRKFSLIIKRLAR